MSTKNVEAVVDIRWAIKRDIPTILAIEQASYDNPWTEDELTVIRRQRDTIGMVAEINDEVVGFMFYELHPRRLHLSNFAVDPSFRRQGVGSSLMKTLTSKLSWDRRNRITLEVRETNLTAQLFFKSQGFRAVRVLKDFYDDADEDAYLMQYRHVGD